MSHESVLLAESINALNVNSYGIYVDCTLGRGGHSSKILEHLKVPGHLYAIDQDQVALTESFVKLSQINGNFSLINGNFRHLQALLALEGVVKVDGILYDLGVSSPQLDDPLRGFSYRFDAALDMRMNQTQKLTAKTVVNELTQSELTSVFYRFGNERFAKQIAKNIVINRNLHPIETTFDLVKVIKSALPQKVLKQTGHPAKKVFQAIRIYVNDEVASLKESLTQATKLLKPKGRIVVITFHSLEEQIVKDLFKSLTISPKTKVMNRIPITINEQLPFKIIKLKSNTPSQEEVLKNNRSHSAKIWILERN